MGRFQQYGPLKLEIPSDPLFSRALSPYVRMSTMRKLYKKPTKEHY
jgi:hypothetical protein